MRKIIAIEFISLDGVIQSPGSKDEDPSNNFTSGGWITHFKDQKISSLIKKEMNLSFEVLLGRTTFDIQSHYWPDNFELWPKLQNAKKYVVSHTLKDHEWKPVVFLDDKHLYDTIIGLKHMDGPNLHLYGSSQLCNFLLNNKLIDEIWLKTYPVVLGNGKKLFSDNLSAFSFELKEAIIGENGIIAASYVLCQMDCDLSISTSIIVFFHEILV